MLHFFDASTAVDYYQTFLMVLMEYDSLILKQKNKKENRIVHEFSAIQTETYTMFSQLAKRVAYNDKVYSKKAIAISNKNKQNTSSGCLFEQSSSRAVTNTLIAIIYYDWPLLMYRSWCVLWSIRLWGMSTSDSCFNSCFLYHSTFSQNIWKLLMDPW